MYIKVLTCRMVLHLSTQQIKSASSGICKCNEICELKHLMYQSASKQILTSNKVQLLSKYSLVDSRVTLDKLGRGRDLKTPSLSTPIHLLCQ
jgi:hypothetical protein